MYTICRHPIDASCPVVDADKEARQHFEAMVARESMSIAGSVPCYTTGSPLNEDASVADACSADGSAIAVDLLTAPECSSYAGEPCCRQAASTSGLLQHYSCKFLIWNWWLKWGWCMRQICRTKQKHMAGHVYVV